MFLRPLKKKFDITIIFTVKKISKVHLALIFVKIDGGVAFVGSKGNSKENTFFGISETNFSKNELNKVLVCLSCVSLVIKLRLKLFSFDVFTTSEKKVRHKNHFYCEKNFKSSSGVDFCENRCRSGLCKQ